MTARRGTVTDIDFREGVTLIGLDVRERVGRRRVRLGLIERHLPLGLKRRLSMNSRYWD